MLSYPARRAASAARSPLLVLCLLGVSACSDDPAASPGAGNTTSPTSSSASGAGTMTSTSAGASTTGSGATATAISVSAASTTGAATSATGAGGGSAATATTAGVNTSGTATTGSFGGNASTGAGGSSTGNASTGAGGSGGGTSTAAVTDDFETVAAGGPPDPALWQLRLPGGDNAIEVTTEQAHGGAQSVKVVGASGSTMFFNESAFPLPSGVVYFRVWMRFSNADWSNHSAFVEASPGGDESQEVRFGGQNNAYNANLAADGDGLSPDPFEYPECSRCVAPVADQWQCVQGKLDFANNAAELSVGGALAVDSASDGWHSGTGMFPRDPTQLGFGWALYGAMANTVYYDDLAIGYEPIACD